MDPEMNIPPNVKTEVLTRTRKRKVLTAAADEVLPVHRTQVNDMQEAEVQEQERQDELFERWLHSPERTKKWRHRLAKMEKADAAKQEGPLADMWVQCENPDCLKWRRLTAEQGTEVDGSAPWFCHMNPNAAYQSCSEPQEDFYQVERMARRLGIKYISTSLVEGTVVWTKMQSFCRWPGVVTTDYNFGVHVYVDADDEPLSYHVEYLGEVHTRGWVSAAQTALYGSVDEVKQLEEAAAPDPNRKKRRSIEKKPNTKGCRNSFYKQGIKCTLQAARREADELMTLSIADRLTRVVFGHASFQPAVTTTDNNVVEKAASAASEQPNSSLEHMKKPAPRTKQNKPSTSKASAQPAEAPRVAPPSPQPSVTGGEAVRRQLQGETGMIHCVNKEEKFTIDVQMYKKNEKAFEHDVRRFMIRNERPISRELPVWKGVPVNLFQLFLAVYDRGGYLQAIERRQFQQIYREMTGTSVTTGSTTVKHFYERNLYPYELHINNKDYSHCFEAQFQKPTAAKDNGEASSTIKGKKRRKPQEAPADSASAFGGEARAACGTNQEVPSASTSFTHSDNSSRDNGKVNMTTKEQSHLPHSLAKLQHDKTAAKFVTPHSTTAGVDNSMSRHVQPLCIPGRGTEAEPLCTPPTDREGERRHPIPAMYGAVKAMSPMHSSQEVPTVSGSEEEYYHGGMADRELREIDNMLSQLDSFSTGFYSTNDYSYFGGDKVEHPLSEGSVQAWSHHFREADSASACGQPTMPLEGAQVVPEVEEELDYIQL